MGKTFVQEDDVSDIPRTTALFDRRDDPWKEDYPARSSVDLKLSFQAPGENCFAKQIS